MSTDSTAQSAAVQMLLPDKQGSLCCETHGKGIQPGLRPACCTSGRWCRLAGSALALPRLYNQAQARGEGPYVLLVGAPEGWVTRAPHAGGWTVGADEGTAEEGRGRPYILLVVALEDGVAPQAQLPPGGAALGVVVHHRDALQPELARGEGEAYGACCRLGQATPCHMLGCAVRACLACACVGRAGRTVQLQQQAKPFTGEQCPLQGLRVGQARTGLLGAPTKEVAQLSVRP